MTIDLLQSVTFQNTLDDVFRKAELQPVTRTNVRALLEKEGADGKPLVLILAGVRDGRKPGRFIIREVRRVLAYESIVFLDQEGKRLEEERKAEQERRKQGRLDQIKGGLRAERRSQEKEGQEFDRVYDAQREQQSEKEIEKKALAILEEEEKRGVS